jgi:hypothetical protein
MVGLTKDGPFSPWLAALGLAIWLLLFALAVILGGEDRHPWISAR